MKKYAIIVDNTKKTVDVLLNDQDNKAIEMVKRDGFELMEVEKGNDGFWYLKGYEPKDNEQEKLLNTITALEKETGYIRLIREMYFNLKKIGFNTNFVVEEKMNKIEELAIQYRINLNKEDKNAN